MDIDKYNSALVFCCRTHWTQNVQVKPTHTILNITWYLSFSMSHLSLACEQLFLLNIWKSVYWFQIVCFYLSYVAFLNLICPICSVRCSQSIVCCLCLSCESIRWSDLTELQEWQLNHLLVYIYFYFLVYRYIEILHMVQQSNNTSNT